MKYSDDKTFGQRLKEAFDNARNSEIARKLGISDAAVKNYVEGRVPPADMLLTISSLTNCSIHWLLTGEGPKSRAALLQSSNGSAAEEEIPDEELAALYHNYDQWTDEDKEEMRRVVRFVRKKLQEQPQKKKK